MNIIVTNLLLMIVFSVVGFIVTVTLHEFGHMVCGLMTGYKFVYIQFLGIKISSEQNRLGIKKCEFRPIGQCIMAPNSVVQSPYALILGGVVFNVLAGIVLLIIAGGIFYSGTNSGDMGADEFTVALRYLVIALINIILGLYNLCGNKYELDGNTFKEVRSDKGSRHAYNNIMLISCLINDGKKWGTLNESLFFLQSTRTGLLAELTLYSCINEISKITVYRDIKKSINSLVNRLNILIRCRYPDISVEAGRYINILKHNNCINAKSD